MFRCIYNNLSTLAIVVLLGFYTQVSARSQTSLWDISQGSVVTAHSPVRDTRPTGGETYSDIANIFGAAFGNIENDGSSSDTIFQDGFPEGFVHYVEWRTPTLISLQRVRLQASGDLLPPDYRVFIDFRDFGQFTLYFKDLRTRRWVQLYRYTPAHPEGFLTLDVNLPTPVVAQEFRAEFTQYDPPSLNHAYHPGPRIIRLEGFGTVVGIPVAAQAGPVTVIPVGAPRYEANPAGILDALPAGWRVVEPVNIRNDGNAPVYDVRFVAATYSYRNTPAISRTTLDGLSYLPVSPTYPLYATSTINYPLEAIPPQGSAEVDLEFFYPGIPETFYPFGSGQNEPLYVDVYYATAPPNSPGVQLKHTTQRLRNVPAPPHG